MNRVKRILNNLSVSYTRRNRGSTNWKVVVLCFIAATTFWLFSALNESHTAQISYPVQFELADSNIVVMEELPQRVPISVTGGGWNLLRRTFWFDIQPLVITVTNPTEQKYLLGRSLLGSFRDHMEEVEVNAVFQDTLYLNVERRIRKKVPVMVDTMAIYIRKNYRRNTPVVLTPDSVEFIGPQSEVDSLPDTVWISVEPKDIDQDFFEEFNVEPENAPHSRVDPPYITMKFGIKKLQEVSGQVTIDPIFFPDDGLMLSDTIAEVTILVYEEQVSMLKPDNLQIVADYRKMKRDSTILPEIVYVPDKVLGVIMDSVRIKVLKRPVTNDEQ
ncbi:hypothetical protein AB9P05_07925 [Roseivirga sp. BDSF3-8]|uniref:hypothetical protein n=1 Tax=Roseivirga sp. BDSF3-8 TaxID=3241598 RepID=UPI0035320B66